MRYGKGSEGSSGGQHHYESKFKEDVILKGLRTTRDIHQIMEVKVLDMSKSGETETWSTRRKYTPYKG